MLFFVGGGRGGGERFVMFNYPAVPFGHRPRSLPARDVAASGPAVHRRVEKIEFVISVIM